MRKIMSLLIIGLCLSLAGPVLAQQGSGQGMGPGPGMGRGMGPGRGMGMMYNPETVTTIKGAVENVSSQGGRRMRHETLAVKTDQGSIMVHLGPDWYISQQHLVLNPGDAVEVTGSKLDAAGSTIVAKEVTVGGKTFQLRNDQGLPLWRSQGRPQPK